MDQTNLLAEVTHKRRVSALGPGGLSRERLVSSTGRSTTAAFAPSKRGRTKHWSDFVALRARCGELVHRNYNLPRPLMARWTCGER
jgi:hypothetical protein